jgi:hypothetical protein
VKPATVCGLAIAAGMFAAASICYGEGDGDLWWQRQLGELVLTSHALPATLGSATFSAPGAAWIPHEWIFATLWALANRCNVEILFRMGCAGLGFLTILIQAVRSSAASPRAQLVALSLVVCALMPSFGVRAQIVGWPLLALVMLALESGPRRAWFALPLAVVWYNLHASGLILPVIVLVHGIGQTIETRRLRTLVSPLALAAACGLASLATPFGSALPRFALSWSANSATALIVEWAPASFDKISMLAGMLIVAALLVVGELRGARLNWAQRLLALVLFAATMQHIRNLGLFCVVAGPWAAASLDVLLPSSWRVKPQGWRNDAGLAIVGICLAIGLVVLRERIPIVPLGAGPAVARLTALHAPLRVACEDFSWCSRFAADDRVQVLLDGRTDAYPAAVFADFRQMARGDALPVFARWRINAAVVHEKGALARTLTGAGWKMLRAAEPQVYLRPSGSAVKRRPPPAASARIADAGAQSEPPNCARSPLGRDDDRSHHGFVADPVGIRRLEDEPGRLGH